MHAVIVVGWGDPICDVLDDFAAVAHGNADAGDFHDADIVRFGAGIRSPRE